MPPDGRAFIKTNIILGKTRYTTLGKNPLHYAGEKPAALGFFSQEYLALRGAFGNGSGK